jgi:hypothetical protein
VRIDDRSHTGIRNVGDGHKGLVRVAAVRQELLESLAIDSVLVLGKRDVEEFVVVGVHVGADFLKDRLCT